MCFSRTDDSSHTELAHLVCVSGNKIVGQGLKGITTETVFVKKNMIMCQAGCYHQTQEMAMELINGGILVVELEG